MRFSSHLSRYLTPEWKRHYIDYEGLKKEVYLIFSKREPVEDEGEERDGLSEESNGNLIQFSYIDEVVQSKFFDDIKKQLENINSFFKARESEVGYQLRMYEEEVEVLQAMRAHSRIRTLRSTKKKHNSLKRVISEFYYSLILLQNFQQLNRTGFQKVLKKHDKLAWSKKGLTYFKGVVCKSYFVCQNQLEYLIERTKALMIDKLEDGNRSRAINRLRVPPLETRDKRSHLITLFAGLLIGALAVLTVVAVILYILYQDRLQEHFGPTFRGLRVGFLLWLWFSSFATNTYFWRKFGVNNILIFEFDPRNNLNFVELFVVSSLIGILFMVGVFLTLFSDIGGYPEWVGPLVMMGLMALLLSLPLPVLFYRSRLWLANICCRIFSAPFCHVNFADFWIAAQMNSLVLVFLDLEYFWCYMFYGLHVDYSINYGSVKYGLRPIVAVLPAWFRFAQCLRRYWNTKQKFPHLVNAGKYSTSFFVVFFSSVAAGLKVDSQDIIHQSVLYHFFFVLWIVSSIVSTCYTFTWDIKMDWGLFSGHHTLREELIYRSKLFYWLAIMENLVFHCLWTLNISVGDGAEGIYLSTLLGVLEITRRFFWNFFRLENEHLNNCGAFQVIRDIAIHPHDPNVLVLNDEVGELSVTLQELGTSKRSGLRNRQSGMTTVNECADPQEDRDTTTNSSSSSDRQNKDVTNNNEQIRVSVDVEEESREEITAM